MEKYKYQIKTVPEESYMDENVSIEITGEPEKNLKLMLSTEDYYNINSNIRMTDVGSLWKCTIPVNLDKEGHKTLDAKVFTALTIRKAVKSNLEKDLGKLPENRECHIRMALIKDNKVIVEKVHKRVFCDAAVKSEDIISNKLLARYFSPDVSGKKPAVIVVSGSDGRIEKAQAIAECLAMKGFSALAICYFGMNHVPDNLDRVPMEYIQNAIAWLTGRPEVDSERIGIYGRSKGGEMVLLASCLFHQIKFVVANVPSNYVNEGLGDGNRPSGHSSWCYREKEIPFVKDSVWSMLRLATGFIKKDRFAFRKFYQYVTWMRGNPKYPNARIQIEKTNAEYLLIASFTDAIWPSDKYISEAEKILTQNGKKNNFKSNCYPDSGHMLTIPYQPIPNCREYGGELKKSIAATIDSWNITLHFLKENCKNKPQEQHG